MFINYPPVPLNIFLYININLFIVFHIKLYIMHTYRILATQTINIFYNMYILLYYQNPKCTFTIILLLVKINQIILGFALYQITTLQKFVVGIATRHYHTSQLTPQAYQKSGQYRSGHNWYSKLIRFEHEHRLLKF